MIAAPCPERARPCRLPPPTHRCASAASRLSPAERVLRVDGAPAALGARAFDLLLALARAPRAAGQPSRSCSTSSGPAWWWKSTTSPRRSAACASCSAPSAIATVPGRGYRFVATLDEAPDGDRPAPRTPAPPRHNLPEPRTRFIGREAALADLARLLPQIAAADADRHRRLRQDAAGAAVRATSSSSDFPDGVWFVDLAPLKEAAARGARLRRRARARRPSPTRRRCERLVEHLAERQALLVLDNCEHVRDGVAALADALLARAGPSTDPRHQPRGAGRGGRAALPGALAVAAGVGRPARRARRRVGAACSSTARAWPCPSSRSMPTTPRALAEICRRLDGIALAIELAAARVHDAVGGRHRGAAGRPLSPADRRQCRRRAPADAAARRCNGATTCWSPPSSACCASCRCSPAAGRCEAATAVAQAADEYEALALLDGAARQVAADRRSPSRHGRRQPAALPDARDRAPVRAAAAGRKRRSRCRTRAPCRALPGAGRRRGAAPARSAAVAVDGAAARRAREPRGRDDLVCPGDRRPSIRSGACGWPRPPAGTGSSTKSNSAVAWHCGALQRDRDAADSAARCEALLGLASDVHAPRARRGGPAARASGAGDGPAPAACLNGRRWRSVESAAA